MKTFIDEHRDAHGVEPICKVLPIAPSTCFAHAARRADPDKQSTRAKSDAALMIEIRRVFDENFGVHGARKNLPRAKRGGVAATRPRRDRRRPLHGGAPDASSGTARRRAGTEGPHHSAGSLGGLPARPGEPAVQGTTSQRVVGVGLPLCRDLVRVRLRRIRDRRLRPSYCRLASFPLRVASTELVEIWSRGRRAELRI